jgi:hypothetical protein
MIRASAPLPIARISVPGDSYVLDHLTVHMDASGMDAWPEHWLVFKLVIRHLDEVPITTGFSYSHSDRTGTFASP